MKYRLQKMTLQELLKAAAGEFEVDVTPELLKAAGIDEDALKLGIATKGSSIDDARFKALEDKVDTLINTLPTVIEAALKAAMPQGETLDAEVMAKVKGFDPAGFTAALTGLKGEITALTEKATQAMLTATAVKGEVEKVQSTIVSGAPTAEMLALAAQQNNRHEVGVFGNNVLFAQ